jgi:serine O-acetyltransferase
MFTRLKQDIATVMARDPAARSALEVVLCYPGVHALALHRLAATCWHNGFTTLGRFISHLARFLTGIEIHPGATIGQGVFIDHGLGVVIGETAVVGDDCTIYQGVTLGGTSLTKGAKRHPTLEKGVIVAAGAKVLGGFTVGAGARVGSNAVLLKAVPPNATAVGIPARIIEADTRSHEPGQFEAKDFSAYGLGATQGTAENDPLSKAMRQMMEHINAQDRQIQQLRDELALLQKNQPNPQIIGECGPPLDTAALSKLID